MHRSSWPLIAALACGPNPADPPAGTTTAESSSSVPTSTPAPDTTTDAVDLPADDTEALPECVLDHTCARIDLLFVIDNSPGMGPAQQRLAAEMAPFLESLLNLFLVLDGKVHPDLNILVTTTDVGHPLCEPFNKPDYTPARGAPTTTPCTDRLARFAGLPEVCTASCPPGQAAAPADPFIHLDESSHNIVDFTGEGDPVAAALACVIPQGVDGCAMESPLEAMLLALDPEQPWNQGPNPFLRRAGVLVVVILTDAPDCSVADHKYFDPLGKDDPEVNQYWEDLPDMPGVKGDPTRAICWNSAMTCDGPDQNGIYADCHAVDNGVLHPVDRYTTLLEDTIPAAYDKEVVMLLLTGVPPVTTHNPDPPFQPVEGGILDLVHRTWTADDIFPGDPMTAPEKEFEFGIGPGCSDPATGQALPPGRLQPVCQSLDRADDPSTPEADETAIRCCIESICDPPASHPLDCLTGILLPGSSDETPG